MKRNFKENPKCIFSAKGGMKRLVDGLNRTKIFKEKIPYLVIGKGEKRMASNVKVKLTFQEKIQGLDAILQKLNEIPNFSFTYHNQSMLEIIDMTEPEYDRSYLVSFKVLNLADAINDCTLTIGMFKEDMTYFELILTPTTEC